MWLSSGTPPLGLSACSSRPKILHEVHFVSSEAENKFQIFRSLQISVGIAHKPRTCADERHRHFRLTDEGLMDQDMTTDNADSGWPEISADVTAARGAARSITLDTQRASTDGRIIEITAQLEQMRERLGSLEDHIFAVDASVSNTQDYAERFAALDQEISTTSSRFETLAARVAAAEEGVATTMMMSVDGFDSRLAVVEDARLAQTGELNELTSYLEQAFTRITELAEVIEQERTSNSAARTGLTEQSALFASSIDGRMDEVHASIADLKAQLDQAAASIDSSAGEIDAALAESVADLQGRMATAEGQVGKIDEIATSLQFLNSRADALDSQQQEISANQATRSDLSELAEQVHRVDAHAQELEARAVESGERRSEIADNVQHAHERIDDTKQEIDQLRTQISEPGEALPSPAMANELEDLRSSVSSVVGEQDVTRVALTRDREDINAHGNAIQQAEAEHEVTRQLVQDVSDRIGNMAENSELIGHRVDLVQGSTEGLQERVEELRSTSTSLAAHVEHIDGNVHNANNRLDNAATALDAAHARLDDVEATAQSAHVRIEETVQELNVRFDESAHAVNDRLDEARQEVDARLGHNADHLNSRLDETVDQVNQRLDETVDQVNQRLDETVDRQLGETVGNIEEVRGRLASIDDELGNTNGRIQDIEQESVVAAEHATQMSAKLDQTIDCVEGAVRATADIAERVTATEEVAAEFGHQVAESEAHLASLDARAHAVETQSTEVERRVAELDQRVSEAEHIVSAGEERFASTEQHLSSNEERIATSEQRIEEHGERFEHVEDRISQTHAQIEERTGALRDHLLSRVDEARAQLQLALDESNAKAGDSNADLRDSVFNRLEIVEQSIETRVAGLEATLSNTDQEPRLQSLETSIADAEARTSEAYAFTESLRQLQTDIVQALQEELRSHEDQLGSFNTRLHQLESSGDDYASGERVHMLEAKLVEALQTISQLTQLQRRNTTVEAQLTDTLTATSHGVESAQSNVSQLREELAAAQQRIGLLEQRLSTNNPSGQIPPASEQLVHLDSHDQAQPSNGYETADASVEDDADTGWFTESYARKNQEPRAS